MRSDSPTKARSSITTALFSSRVARPTVIPGLFILLILITQAFALVSLFSARHQTAALSILAEQEQLRARYLHHILSGEPSSSEEQIRLVRQLQKNLNILLAEHTPDAPPEAPSIRPLPPPDELIRQELKRKQAILNTLDQDTNRLSGLSSTSPKYTQTLSRILASLRSLENPNAYLPPLYLEASHKQNNRTFLWETVVVLLTGGLGITLAFQQRKAYRSVKEGENLLRQIFGNAPIGKILITPEQEASIVTANNAFCKMLGYDMEELGTTTWQSLCHPDDVAMETSLRTALMEGSIPSYQVEKRFIRKDGQTVWTSSSTALIREPNGKPRYVIVQAQDITEQRNNQQALELSETQYRNLVESANEGIILANMDSIILTANSRAYQIFGYEPGELNGKPLTMLMPFYYRRAHLDGIKRLRQTHEPHHAGKLLELAGLHKNGTEFPLELTLSAWYDPQGEMLVTGMIRDISERRENEKEREALLQRNRSLEEFAAIASHDLQEPLRKIAFYTERFANRENKQLSEDSLMDIQRILSSVYRMQTLITDLLGYSRINSITHFQMTDLSRIMQIVLEKLAGQIQKYEARIELDPLPTVEADPTQMEQLFTHLIQNALKYRQSGVSPHVHIYGNLQNTESLLEKVPNVELFIEDNGIGFDEKYLDRIFKIFQRLHGSKELTGTGVGLAVCRKIAEQHHGKITASSKPGVGSTFIVTLPLRQP